MGTSGRASIVNIPGPRKNWTLLLMFLISAKITTYAQSGQAKPTLIQSTGVSARSTASVVMPTKIARMLSTYDSGTRQLDIVPDKMKDELIDEVKDREQVEEGSLKADPCRSTVNAMSVIREEYHVFSGKWFWRVNRRSGLVRDDPIEINLLWYILPPGIQQVDAVYERTPNGKIVFFIGSVYWELDDNRSGKFPRSGRPLTDLGLPSHIKHIDAAFIWPKDNRTYLVIGDQLWRLNESGSGVENNSRTILFNAKLDKRIDAAFKDLEGNVNFLHDDYFWRVADPTNLTMISRQLRNESWMFGCNRPTEIISLPNFSARSPNLGILAVIVLVVLVVDISDVRLNGFTW